MGREHDGLYDRQGEGKGPRTILLYAWGGQAQGENEREEKVPQEPDHRIEVPKLSAREIELIARTLER